MFSESRYFPRSYWLHIWIRFIHVDLVLTCICKYIKGDRARWRPEWRSLLSTLLTHFAAGDGHGQVIQPYKFPSLFSKSNLLDNFIDGGEELSAFVMHTFLARFYKIPHNSQQFWSNNVNFGPNITFQFLCENPTRSILLLRFDTFLCLKFIIQITDCWTWWIFYTRESNFLSNYINCKW